MDEYITKPVRAEELTKAIESYIERRQKGTSTAPQPAPPAPVSDGTGSAAAEPPVDMERLTDFSAGDEAALLELAQMYLTQAAGHLEALTQAVRCQAAAEVKRVAHTFAGSSATCGMVAVVPALRTLEKMGHEQNLTGAPAGLSEVVRESARIREFLARRLPALGA